MGGTAEFHRASIGDLSFNVEGTQNGDQVTLSLVRSGTPSGLSFGGLIRGITMLGKLNGAAFGFLGTPADSAYFTLKN